MARIRTIKPEFFTSEDIVALSPLARLLYIATWCEADKEGRLPWRPRTFKLRYLPADDCDAEAICAELVSAGLVVLYGEGLAYIPAFTEHQHVNPRETASSLPDPYASARVDDASARVKSRIDPQGGREGKGREGKEVEHARSPTGSRLPADWQPSETELRWAADARPDIDAKAEVERFRDYWHGVAGAKGRKLDWPATWRNWIRSANAPRHAVPRGTEPASLPRLTA